MTINEVLDIIIYDMQRAIGEYQEYKNTAKNYVEIYNMAIRIEELKSWINIIKDLRDEPQ